MHVVPRFIVFGILTLSILSSVEAAERKSAGTISGVVKDATGKVVEGAAVFDTDAKWPAVTSGNDGRFTLKFQGETVRYMMLIASTPNDELMGLWEADELDPSSLEASAEVTITVKPSKKVAARVIDAKGEPVAGASIAARQAYEFIAFAESDAEGRATLRVPEDARMSEIVAMKPGVGLDYFENVASRKWLDVKPLPKEEVALTLNGINRFQLRAVDSKGKPIAGAEFGPWTIKKPGKMNYTNLSGHHPQFPISRRTDAHGVATFDYLPAQVERAIAFLCYGEEWHQQADILWPPKGGADASAPMPETVLLRTVKASGMVLREDGQPAANVLLQAEGRGNTNHYCRETTRTAADGTFEFLLYPEQSYIIATLHKDAAAPSTKGFIIHEGEERSDLFFTLGKGTLVHGKVSHLETGAPLAGSTVTIIERGAKVDLKALMGKGRGGEDQEGLVRWVKTDVEGRYSIRLGTGTYEVSADYSDDDKGEIYVGAEPEMKRDFRIRPRS